MENIEHAYFLDELQLLLLLSLIDKRPVPGFSLGDPTRLKESDWTQVALTLVRDGQLDVREGRMEIEEQLREMLVEIKNASRILSVCSSAEERAMVRMLYFGQAVTVLEPDGPSGYRVSRREKLTQEWLAEKAGTVYLPDELADTMLENPELSRRISEWMESAPGLDVPPAQWVQRKEARVVLDLYVCGSRAIRWVWLEDPLCPQILRQDEGGSRVLLDTAGQRGALLKEFCETEESHAAG